MERIKPHRVSPMRLDTIITVHYDDAECDGYCLMEDIGFVLEEDEKPQTGGT